MDNLFRKVAESMESGQSDPRVGWHKQARSDQLQPGGDWSVWLVRGGRGSGKTHTGSNTLVEWILNDRDSTQYQEGAWGIVGPTFSSAWTVCVEGESGILSAFGTTMGEVRNGRSKYVAHAWRSHGEIRLRDGDVIYVDSANDGADRVQGKNLKGVWCDELGMWTKWEQAWDESIKYAVRIAGSRIIATTTPKVSRPAAKLIRRLIQDPSVPVAKLRTIDNAKNLSEAFIDGVVGRAKGTRLEKQELEGELIDDVSGALWLHSTLEATEVRAIPDGVELRKVYVGVDPSDGKESSDEQAFTVVGMGSDGHLYVLESWGDRVSPNVFLRKAVDSAERWGATLVVERNHGQGYLDLSLQQVQKDMGTHRPVRLEHASKAKRTRAEPVAALYERKFVHHVKPVHDDNGDIIVDEALDELEDQMCSFTGALGEKSPDRLDSLVWAIHPFLNYNFGKYARGGYIRKWDVAQEADAASKPPTRGRHRAIMPPDPYAPIELDNPEHAGWIPPNVHPVRNNRVRRWDSGGILD